MFVYNIKHVTKHKKWHSMKTLRVKAEIVYILLQHGLRV